MKGLSWIYSLLSLIILVAPLWSQAPANDECFSSYFIEDISDYCSMAGEYSTEGATQSFETEPDCWPQGTTTNDVWFSFVPTTPGVYIQVAGATSRNTGTLVQPSISIYSGSCRNLTEEACSSDQSGTDNIVELTLSEMVIGRVYYLRVDGRDDNVGDFQLCIEQFFPQKLPEADCDRAVVLCDKSTFFIENLEGIGTDRNEVGGSCIGEEFASVWYRWVVDQSGSLTFTLEPNNIDDDLDFAIYRLPSGSNDPCREKELVRCMSSGETLGASASANRPCQGRTGLRNGSNDIVETPGCSSGDDNFLAPLDMISGEEYVLIVNNYSQSGFGFSVDFGGTGTFRGPEPDFEIEAIQAFECDKTILFNNITDTSNLDPIISYEWSFGEGATPLNGSGPDQQSVVYESFGDKIAALTVLTTRGCQVTQILPFQIDACCADTSDLAIDATGVDLTCYQSGDGRIEIEGEGGFPEYSYSVNGGRFMPNPIVSNLNMGTYQVGVQDIKGCEQYINVTLDEPPPLELEIGALEDTVALGFSTDFFSFFGPDDRIVSYEWSPDNGALSCTDCPDPEVRGLGTTTYTLKITDQDGCMTERTLTLFTSENRPYYAPNALSELSLSGNDQFKIITNVATDIIEYVVIFDRWGGEMYRAENIVYDDSTDGWDGYVNGQKVNPGVFVWIAKIRFVDGKSFTFTGDITVF